MPIRIPDGLPARDILVSEGVSVMDQSTAIRQDIRPLRFGLLNLMPNKIETETQVARLIAATPIQIELLLIRAATHESKTTSRDHLSEFYRTWEEVEDTKFDGFIVTGAPIGVIPYDEITYWDEIKKIFDWTTNNVLSTLFFCWGAMAACYYFHGIHKKQLDEKLFGVFPLENRAPQSPYLQGFSDDIHVPVSRWTTMSEEEILANSELELLLTSSQSGPCMLREETGRRLYMFNHFEYDAMTLADEYKRDLEKGGCQLPVGYFPQNDPQNQPLNTWRSHAHLFYSNWINQIYQYTPYKIGEIGKNGK